MPLIQKYFNTYENSMTTDLVMVRFRILGMTEPQKEALDYELTMTILMDKSHLSQHIRRQRLPSLEGILIR